jgi:hypothetical protein
MKLDYSELEVGDKVSSTGHLYIYAGDSYNGGGQATSIPRAEALELIAHLRTVFELTHAEMHWETELKD